MTTYISFESSFVINARYWYMANLKVYQSD